MQLVEEWMMHSASVQTYSMISCRCIVLVEFNKKCFIVSFQEKRFTRWFRFKPLRVKKM